MSTKPAACIHADRLWDPAHPTNGGPLGWRKPCRVFVNSLSDLYGEDFTNERIAAVFGVMATCPQHTFQVLTKHAVRMASWFEWLAKEAVRVNAGRGMPPAAFCLAMAQKNYHRALSRNVTRTCGQPWPLPNVWIGVSVEDQQQADDRLPHLLRSRAVVRFVSYEPALGPVDLDLGRCDDHDREFVKIHEGEEFCGECSANGYTGELSYGHWLDGLDWLIVGGGALPFDLEWAHNAVKQCRDAGVAVFVKQFGPHPISAADSDLCGRVGTLHELRADTPSLFRVALTDREKGGNNMAEWPDDLRVREFPKDRS